MPPMIMCMTFSILGSCCAILHLTRLGRLSIWTMQYKRMKLFIIHETTWLWF
ncbi:hypothetical protein NC653_019146 [Populus alba x Populus x berolinensis]|uniref:Uncharacterized protein n=1 Tax=Populus alba x Populus x berolinensis TaxID=444605 RepID=A0AAD6VWS3_9ROSI|nr:hypothetical protein NC653_019146 [Populus alba x Populus x berolinensis]